MTLLKALHSFLDEFRWLAKDVATRPTRIAELIPDTTPATIGACDAAGTRMGGIYFVPTSNGFITPLLWRQWFPPWIQRQLVSFSNPDGTINNSELELVGLLAHNNILEIAAKVEERTIHNVYTNTAVVFWQRKGAITTTNPPVYLLCLQVLHQRQFRFGPKHDYNPGQSNVMAGFLSRVWHSTDVQIVTHFNSHFPQPEPWKICHLRKPMNSSLILGLSKKQCQM